ncbi:MAG: CPBP family intramembrane metalloprotease [Planctomycetota bacterium]|nr:CPBP family intramembrane metalloprotease [Planctomycetota bacterium]
MDELPSDTSRRADTCAVVFALCYPTLLTYVYFTALAQAPTVVQHAAFGSLKLIQFAFPLLWHVKFQQRRLELHRPTGLGMLVGIAFGALVVAAMCLLYKHWLLPAGWMHDAKEPIQQKIAGFGVNRLPAYMALGLFYSLFHSLLEEYYWRWFVFAQLRRLVSVPAAVVISSLGFTAHHVLLLGTFFGWSSPLTWLFSLAVGIGGAVWAVLYQRSGSIYPVWLSHLLVDAGIFWIGYDLVGRTFV